MKNTHSIIILLILSIWLLSCSSPKVLYKSTQAVNIDSIQKAYNKLLQIYPRKTILIPVDKTLITFSDYYHDGSFSSSFEHMIERHQDTLTLYYQYEVDSTSNSKEKSTFLFYSTKIVSWRLSQKLKRYQRKPYITIKDPVREGYMIIILPLNGDKKSFLDIDENGLNEDRKERRKFRQTRVLFKRVAKKYYDIPKQYIKY
jgi:hypothetical protein